MGKYVVALIGGAMALGVFACATGTANTSEIDVGSLLGTDGGSDARPGEPGVYGISGSVTGLAGTGLVLQNNGGDDTSVSANGRFTFRMPIATGKPFEITVKTHPNNPAQSCSAANGTGTMGTADISDIAISCVAAKFTVGGTVTSLLGTGLVLQNKGVDLPVAQNGAFTFPTQEDDGASFAVSVKTQPQNPQQNCVVAGATGTIAGGNVASVNVNCSNKKFAIGGTITGLTGTGLVLLNNGGDPLTVGSTGSFAFPATLDDLATYDVTVDTQPTNNWQTCTVSNGKGNVAGAAVSSVAIICATNRYKVKANVSGLNGTGLVLQNNGGNNLTITQNGESEFTTLVPSGSPYVVTTLTNPSNKNQTCVADPGGTVAGGDVVVNVVCTDATYRICGTAEEDFTATLTCPSGTVIKTIDYASFGLPNGACGAFFNGSCHAVNSKVVVENRCLNQASCTVPATLPVFGDPCRNVNKRVFVQATCQ